MVKADEAEVAEVVKVIKTLLSLTPTTLATTKIITRLTVQMVIKLSQKKFLITDQNAPVSPNLKRANAIFLIVPTTTIST